MKRTTGWILSGVGVVALVLVIIFAISAARAPGALDGFAQCLGQKGATFYGAFWCPHCQAQKQLFGKSEKLLPYVECSTPDGKGQLAVCTAKNITGYPTWVFSDGSRVSGEQTLQSLASSTGCSLPAGS